MTWPRWWTVTRKPRKAPTGRGADPARRGHRPEPGVQAVDVMGLEKIGKDQAHLWYGRTDKRLAPRQLRRYESLLSEDERAKLDRYRFAEDRYAGLLARAVLRCLLSRYAAVPPTLWRFRTNACGRPEIAEPESARALRFSVSHTKGLAAVLISGNRDVGLDVEGLPYAGPCLQVADRFFSPAEASALRALKDSERAVRFLQLWTLKEAFLKARGVGLSAPLDQVSFSIDEAPTRKMEVRPGPSLADQPERWQFDLGRIGDGYVVATAIERRCGETIDLVCRDALHAPAPAEGAGPPGTGIESATPGLNLR